MPGTRYFYELRSESKTLVSGPDYSFRTHPPQYSPIPFSILAWGDSGTGNSGQMAVAAQMDAVRPRPALALGIGDLVYSSGEWENYDPRFFIPYKNLTRNLIIWPAMGNHDAITEQGAPYLANFYLPTTSGAPLNPSGNELYYSFDYGNAHFVCLDSQISSKKVGGPMHQWLTDDLEDANNRGMRWKFVFFHHPPYTKGTHNSFKESQLIAMRENFGPSMESAGVDFVITGHSHVYERSYLLKDNQILQDHPDDYTKISTPDGTIYIVSGSGGASGNGDLDHPLMAFSLSKVHGNTVIDISHNESRGYYVLKNGTRVDLFSLHKDDDITAPFVREAVMAAGDLNTVNLLFSEPVAAGGGASGAENPSLYIMDPPLQVTQAALNSDGRTVVLSTGTHVPNTIYSVTVSGVQDRAQTPNSVAADRPTIYQVPHAAGIDPGATWKYWKGWKSPGADWAQTDYDASDWNEGKAGFGYGDGDDATLLNDMKGSYSTVYIRKLFSLSDADAVTSLVLSVDYDDGFVAFLNGVEVARKNVAQGQSFDSKASGGHEANGFESFDIGEYASALVTGTNVLALEGHNVSLSSSDLTLHPALQLEGALPFSPIAKISQDLHRGNAPFTVNLSSVASAATKGDIASVFWDFGDGGPMSSETSPSHTFTNAGQYTISLIVTDTQGAQSVAQQSVFVHTTGEAPVITLDAPQPAKMGLPVTFDATASIDPDGGELFAFWDFSDPNSGLSNRSADWKPSHTFYFPGVYIVRLIVTDDEGSQATQTLEITVTP
jgi:PKD repeat protein